MSDVSNCGKRHAVRADLLGHEAGCDLAGDLTETVLAIDMGRGTGRVDCGWGHGGVKRAGFDLRDVLGHTVEAMRSDSVTIAVHEMSSDHLRVLVRRTGGGEAVDGGGTRVELRFTPAELRRSSATGT